MKRSTCNLMVKVFASFLLSFLKFFIALTYKSQGRCNTLAVSVATTSCVGVLQAPTIELEMLIHVWWGNHCIKCTRFCLSEKYLVCFDGKVKTVTKFAGFEDSGTGDKIMLVVHQAILVVPR